MWSGDQVTFEKIRFKVWRTEENLCNFAISGQSVISQFVAKVPHVQQKKEKKRRVYMFVEVSLIVFTFVNIYYT